MTTDWTMRFANQYYQLRPLHKTAVGKGTVLVRRHLNGELHFCYRERDLPYTLLPERPKAKTVNKKAKSAVTSVPANRMCHQQIMPGAVLNLAKDHLGLAEPKATSNQKLKLRGRF